LCFILVIFACGFSLGHRVATNYSIKKIDEIQNKLKINE
jgi:hypothetical protein